MAKNQKLAAEIDRTIKKVQEGIVLFEDIWEKLHAASAANLKERFQSDLKTEIKKLQRLRDQIKTWQGMPEIRDKRSIDDARRNIEVKMEQFKACERDAKIKTYSKVGLSLPHREDPEEQAREKTREWLNLQLAELNTQLEQFEVEMGGSRKKKGRAAAAAGVASERIVRHRFHIGKLEQLLRLLDNEQVTSEDIEMIQELVEDYVEHSGDPDFIEDEEIYDELATVDIEEAFLEGKNAPEDPPTKKAEKAAEKADRRSTPQSQPKPDPKKAPPPVIAAPAPTTTEETRRKKDRRQAAAADAGDEREKPGTPVTGPGTPASSTAPSMPSMSLGSKQSPVTPAPVATVRATGSGSQPKPSAPGNYAAVAKQAAAGAPKPGAKPGPKGAPTSSSGSTPQATPTHGAATSPTAPPAIGSGVSAAGPEGGSTGRRERPTGTADSRSGSASSRGTPATDPARQPSPLHNRVPVKPEGSPATPVQSGSPAARPAAPRRDEESEARAAMVNRMLAQSAAALPQPEDTRKRQPYIPPNPFRTPTYYPQQPHSTFDNPDIFQKFAPDTLFFIFYYQQSTYQQYIAARELKRQSWRFHKRFQTWFQRADPPKEVNNEYEQGTYVYFDYEDGWAQRIRKDFTFRYCFLEDDLPQ